LSIISERIAKNLSKDVFNSLVHKDVSFFDDKKIGEFLSRLTSDITIVKNGLGVNVAILIRTIFILVLILTLLFIISWKLTLVMLAALLPIMVFINFYAKYEKRFVK
jgi:ATP-binding cassette, subfamily B, bacterial